jgi:enoyl-[acyl-carrier-protein] reductase (NADH)
LKRALAVEWSRYGIRLNAVSPGPIFTEGAFSRLDPTGQFTEHAKERIPVGRLGSPEELSNLVTYLLSDYSSWMTGENINMDGGETRFLVSIHYFFKFNYCYQALIRFNLRRVESSTFCMPSTRSNGI